ncbi:MAG: endonuclease III [Candidatus Caldarchaeum sp.]
MRFIHRNIPSAVIRLESEDFRKVLNLLRQRYGPRDPPLHVSGEDAFWVLIGAVLSHRTRDEMTDRAYKRLRQRFRSPRDLAEADVGEIVKLIRDVGFYRQKARRVKQIARIITFEKSGVVPSDRYELMKLPGVGPKSADIVLSVAYGMPEVAVDTHVETVAKRLGVVDAKAGYEEIRSALKKLAAADEVRLINITFVNFGREVCRKPRPRCQICPITSFCRYYAEKVRDPAP